jgi:selenide,water dikinase
MEIDTGAVPVMEEAWAHVVEGIVPSGAYRNMEGYRESLWFGEGWDGDKQLVFTDPQTNGGLLVAVDPSDADRVVEALRERGHPLVQQIGRVGARSDDDVAVRFS